MAGFTVHDSASQGYDIEIRVTYREKSFLEPTADALCTALTAVYAKAFQEVTERLGDPVLVREL